MDGLGWESAPRAQPERAAAGPLAQPRERRLKLVPRLGHVGLHGRERALRRRPPLGLAVHLVGIGKVVRLAWRACGLITEMLVCQSSRNLASLQILLPTTLGHDVRQTHTHYPILFGKS